MSYSIRDIVAALVVYQAFSIVVFLMVNKSRKQLFNRSLLALCIILGIHFIYMILENAVLRKVYFLGPIFGMAYGPLYYIYCRSLIVKNIKTSTVVLHFIPAFLMSLSLFFLSDEIVAKASYAGAAVTLHYLGYLTVSLLMIYTYRKRLKDTTSTYFNINLRWLEYIIYLQYVILTGTIFESVYQTQTLGSILVLIIFLLALVLINAFYYLGRKQVQLFDGIELSNEKRQGSSEYSIPETQFQDYVKSLSNYMNNQKPYLEFELSLDDLSSELDISKRNLSHVINRAFNRNFYDFVNSYRLDQAKHDLSATSKPVKEIMYDSGFANKATFNHIFKKAMGLTPSQFRAKTKS